VCRVFVEFRGGRFDGRRSVWDSEDLRPEVAFLSSTLDRVLKHVYRRQAGLFKSGSEENPVVYVYQRTEVEREVPLPPVC